MITFFARFGKALRKFFRPHPVTAPPEVKNHLQEIGIISKHTNFNCCELTAISIDFSRRTCKIVKYYLVQQTVSDIRSCM